MATNRRLIFTSLYTFSVLATHFCFSGCASVEAQKNNATRNKVAAKQSKVRVSNTLTSNFNKTTAFTYLKEQVAMGFRVPGQKGHSECADYILTHAKKYSDKAEFQSFTHMWKNEKKYEMRNIIAFQNWEKADVRVVVLAHWDTRPTADEEDTAEKAAKPIPGANDGASGVAVLMELMKHTKAPKKLGICYLFTDGEDLGPDLSEMFIGARYFAKNLPSPKPDYGILIDMIGDKDLEVPIEPNSFTDAKDVTTAIFRHASSIGLAKTFPATLGPAIEDDHIALLDARIPTVDLIDFSYPYWHTLQDTVDKCSPESLGKVGMLLETFLNKPTVFKPIKM